jgi:hypothetical protein
MVLQNGTLKIWQINAYLVKEVKPAVKTRKIKYQQGLFINDACLRLADFFHFRLLPALIKKTSSRHRTPQLTVRLLVTECWGC